MNLNFDRAWADLMTMARSNRVVLATLAGAFLFLPDFARTLFFPAPTLKQFDWAAVDALNAYFSANWFVVILAALVMRFGEATILAMLLDRSRPTVADAMRGALWLLPAYVVTSVFTSVIMLTGFFAFIVPGFYLAGRLTATLPALVAERITNPWHAVERAFVLTRNNGWLIVGLVFLVAVVLALATSAFASATTVLLTLILPEGSRPAFLAMATGLLATFSAVVMLLLDAAIYRQLAASTGT